MNATAAPGTLYLGLHRGIVELRVFFRERDAVFFTFALPAVLLSLLGSLYSAVYPGGVTASQYLAPSMIAAGVASTTFVNLGIAIATDRDDGTLKRLRGVPMPPAAYFLGKVVMVLVLTVAEVALLLAIGVVLFDLSLPADGWHWLTFGWVFLLGVTGCSFLGIAASSLAGSQRSAAAGDEPAVPRAVVRLRRLLHPGRPAAALVAGDRVALPAQVDGAGVPVGVPAGLGSRPGDRELVGTWPYRPGSRRLVSRRAAVVSDDVPLARPPRRLSRAWSGKVPWRLWRRPALWDANVVLIGTATIVLVSLVGRYSVPVRIGAVALVAGLMVWYLAFGRRLIRDQVEDWRGYVYLLGVAALFLPAVYLVNGTGFLLWALCPQPFMLMCARRAIVAVVLLNVGYVLVNLVRTGDGGATLTGALPVAVFAVIASVVFGTWASAIAQQNDERARLIGELEDSRAEVARLSHETGVAAERQRLAGEIHDTIAQGLSSVVMLVQAATAELGRDPPQARRHLDLALNTARENLGEARTLVAALTPTALDGSSLVEALGRLVARFRAETGLRASFVAAGPATALPPPVEVVLLRAAQESLANVRKHAGAAEVHMRLSRVDGSVVLETVDDGAGFVGSGATGGYGLRAMRARVGEASGTLTVESAPGRGTTVRVEVPVP